MVSLLTVYRLIALPITFADLVFSVPLISDFVCVITDDQLISVRIKKLFPERVSLFVAFTGHPGISVDGIDWRFSICIIIILLGQQMIVIFVSDGKSTIRPQYGFFVFVIVFCPIQIAKTVRVFQHRASGFFNIHQLIFVIIIGLNPDHAFGGIFFCDAAVAVDAIPSLVFPGEITLFCYPIP